MENFDIERWKLVTILIIALPPIFLADSVATGFGMAIMSALLLLAAFGVGGFIADRAGVSEWFSKANYRTMSAISILGGLATISGDVSTPYVGYIATYVFVAGIYLAFKGATRGISSVRS